MGPFGTTNIFYLLYSEHVSVMEATMCADFHYRFFLFMGYIIERSNILEKLFPKA